MRIEFLWNYHLLLCHLAPRLFIIIRHVDRCFLRLSLVLEVFFGSSLVSLIFWLCSQAERLHYLNFADIKLWVILLSIVGVEWYDTKQIGFAWGEHDLKLKPLSLKGWLLKTFETWDILTILKSEPLSDPFSLRWLSPFVQIICVFQKNSFYSPELG